ncbi:EthD family reductase [Pleomorphovibrio marinus]|uniref:EthD family reductase n=1 Tax=Pleomorphovibrio marinus TaxID=2164132 RepID=UPI0018E5015E|nr:EthD family reductase [Pleomorphovibrio marinus]
MKKGMIKLSVLYPNGEGKTFDMDYYRDKHIQLVGRLLGDHLKGVAVETGLAGLGEPDTPAPYIVCGHLYFDSMSDLQKSVSANLDQMVGDIPNFTNIQPVVQVAEVVM